MVDYEICAARYAKGMIAVQCPSDDGYKTRAARLADAVARGRWTNREASYIMSPRASRRFEHLYAVGADASVITGEIRMPAND